MLQQSRGDGGHSRGAGSGRAAEGPCHGVGRPQQASVAGAFHSSVRCQGSREDRVDVTKGQVNNCPTQHSRCLGAPAACVRCGWPHSLHHLRMQVTALPAAAQPGDYGMQRHPGAGPEGAGAAGTGLQRRHPPQAGGPFYSEGATCNQEHQLCQAVACMQRQLTVSSRYTAPLCAGPGA